MRLARLIITAAAVFGVLSVLCFFIAIWTDGMLSTRVGNTGGLCIVIAFVLVVAGGIAALLADTED